MGAVLTVHLAALLGTLAVCACANAAPVVEIRMHPLVESSSDEVLLGQAATIHAFDMQTMSSLVALPLGHAPAAGRETLLRRDAIVRWVHTRTGLGPGEIAWTGADEIIVRGRDNSDASIVHRGDWAALRSHASGIDIEDHVEILQDGSAGALVQVRGSGSSASFAARVVGPGLVEANP
jgi:hypothetical protein